MQTIFKAFFSFPTMMVLFALLGIGAGVGTIIENDYSTSTARVLVYNHWWYSSVMVLAMVNMVGIMWQRKLYKSPAKFIFHGSFVVILLGSIITRYVGYEGVMEIDEGQTTNEMYSLEPYIQVFIQTKDGTYYQDFKKEFGAIGDNSFSYTLEYEGKTLHIDYSDYKFAKKQKNIMNLISVNVSLGNESKVVKLVGRRGMPPAVIRDIAFKDAKIKIGYGSKKLLIPFYIKLNDFELKRYPGTKSPSSYSSNVTLIDDRNGKRLTFDFLIYMNHILDYDGYRFFQSSYKPDESGTILSVNHDPGALPTYLGYLLLAIGLLMNLFDSKSRFAKLIRYIKNSNASLFIALFFAFGSSYNLYAQENQPSPPIEISDKEIIEYLKEFKQDSLNISEKFSHLVVQGTKGRMKPMDTLNHEIINKLTKRSSFLGMNANQVVLGMLSRPDIWRNIKMIKIKTPKLKKVLGIEADRKYIAFKEMFDANGNYRLQSLANTAFKTDPNQRGTFEKDIINLDERINIAYMVYYGDLLKIFPQIGKTKTNLTIKDKWFTPLEALEQFKGKDKEIIAMMIRGLINNLETKQYQKASKYIDLIALYQSKLGAKIMPKQSTIDSEIWFNRLDIFFKLTIAYMLIGFIVFILAFVNVFSDKSKKLYKKYNINAICVGVVGVLFLAHTFGLAHRWYISGEAPWSNLYESLVFISYASIVAGMIVGRNSLLALSSATIMASVFMFTAHLGDINPQITQLVPVLKSYWLSIHVSIITGSYGFLGISAMLGYMCLVLFIFRKSKNKKLSKRIDSSILQSLAIGEASMIIGLSMLTIGNFLGGVWANESWGRYWGWDSKETWAYVSIVVYAIVLHLRMMPKTNTPFVFATASTLAFSSIIMTYVGVNFYLSGMHSYATGDPVPIPTWAYVTTIVVFATIFMAYFKRDLPKAKI